MEDSQRKSRVQQASWLPGILLLLVAVVWGTSYGVAKGTLLIYPVLGFLAIRFLITFALLVPVLRRTGLKKIRETIAIGLPLGVILLMIFLCETFGLAKTTAANAAFLISLCVVFTPFAAWLVLRIPPTTQELLATGVSLLGAFLLTDNLDLSLHAGDTLMLAAALLRAYMVTLTKQRTKDKTVDSLCLTAVQAGTVGIGCLLLGVGVFPDQLPALPHNLKFWFATAYLVVFCTIFAFFVQNYAVRKLSPTRVHLLMGTEPVFGALFASFWLHETLTPMIWLGGMLIVAAPVYMTLRPSPLVIARN